MVAQHPREDDGAGSIPTEFPNRREAVAIMFGVPSSGGVAFFIEFFQNWARHDFDCSVEIIVTCRG